MTWKPNIVTRQAIQGFISDLFATAPEIMGIDEAIAGCEVILMDPYTTGALPRYIRVRIREYYQDVMWRGNPSLVVGDFCTVLHFRDGNRYEVIGASGAGGIDLATPYISIWVYDVSLGLIVPYDTINNALGYAPLAAGDFILVPPGTFNESVTLVNGVFICEQIPGTVTLDWTVASGAWTNGTVIVADGGYINVRNIYRTPVAGLDYNAIFIPAAFAGVSTIIAENIRSTGPGNATYGVYFRGTGGGTLHVHAKTITAITPTGVTAAAYRETGATGVVNLYVERGYASGATNGYGVWVNGGTVNVYGGEWEGVGGTAGYGFVVAVSGTLTGLHARAIGSRNDLYNTGGTLQIFQVQYNSVRLAGGGTIDHLPGDHIVLDLDTDTYITALAADDRIDLFVAGANPTDFKFGPSNVITILDNIAQAFSIADAGGLEFLRLDTTNEYFLIDPAAAGINVGVGLSVPVTGIHLHSTGTGIVSFKVTNATTGAGAADGVDFGLDANENFQIVVREADKALMVLTGFANGYVANFFNDGDNQNRYGISVDAGADDGSGTTYYFRARDGNGDLTGVLQTIAGVFQLTDVSDERRKEKIRDTKVIGLDIINGLKVRDYHWKKVPDGLLMTGFIAQEAQEVYPEMVGPFDDGTLGTSRSMLIPVLTKAIQELDARVAKIEQLEI